MIERYAYPIYSENYSREFDQYIGSTIDFIRATIQDTLSEALLQDDRITRVKVLKVEAVPQETPYETAKSQVSVEFEVFTVAGKITIDGVTLSV